MLGEKNGPLKIGQPEFTSLAIDPKPIMLETTATPQNDRNCETVEMNFSVNSCEKLE